MSKIEQTKNSWINMSEKAVYVKIDLEDIEPSKQEYEGNTQHVFVVPKSLLLESIDQNKAIKLGLFKEE